jgi:hypothetical protein
VLSEELHASRIIRAFMREKMPVLAQGNALDLITEIDNSIDAESLKAAGGSANHENLLWVADDFPMGEAARKFGANCLAAVAESAEDDGDSAAA